MGQHDCGLISVNVMNPQVGVEICGVLSGKKLTPLYNALVMFTANLYKTYCLNACTWLGLFATIFSSGGNTANHTEKRLKQ